MSDVNEVSEMLTKKKHLMDYYYDNYLKFYERKAFSKASEYLWGVFNNLITAIALFYGEKNMNHQEIIAFVKQLAHEKNMNEMIEQLSSANSIHANFFHDWMNEDDFEVHKNKTIQLLENLKIILNELEKPDKSSIKQT